MKYPSTDGVPQPTKHHSRRKSLQVAPQPLDTPIPPSLLQSPYLHSPQSIFKRTLSASHQPSEEDEQWLQDTVPISLDPRDEEMKRGRLFTSSQASSEDSSEDSRHLQPSGVPSMGARSSSRAPPSPPLVRWRHPNHLYPPTWPGQPRVHSAPCATEREYFVGP